MNEWRISSNYFEVFNAQKGGWFPVSEAFGVEKVEVDLLTGLHNVLVFVESARAGRNCVIEPRSSLQQKTLMTSLLNLGLTLPDTDEERVVIQDVLLEQDKAAPLEYKHQKLGFATVDGVEVFLLDKVIGDLSLPKGNSRYYLEGVFTPTGSLSTWTDFIKKEVLGWVPMELALAAGAAAPVAHLLKKQGRVFEMPIIAYIGTSSVGKTTALRLSASLWGRPIEGDGIIDNLNCTENAFLEAVSSNIGVPSFIDETSAKPQWDFDRMVYFLPSGKGKKRCSQDGTIRPASVFSGAVIFTGERSLMQMTQKQNGMFARIAEFNFEQWAKDEAHAERISETCSTNFGVAAPVLVKWLLVHRAELPLLFENERQKLREREILYPGVEARIVKIYAIILTAAYALNLSLGLSLDLEALRGALIQQLMDGRAERDKIGDAYQSVLIQIAEHGTHFSWPNKRDTDHPREKDMWGTFDYYKSIPCVWLTSECLEKMLANKGIHSVKEVQKPWTEKKWMVDFGSRHYCRTHAINGIPVPCHCILLPQAPSLFERLGALPSNAESADLIKVLRGGSMDAALPSRQLEDNRNIKDGDEKEDKMAVGIIKPSYQGEKVIFNSSLSKVLYLKDEAFACLIPDHRLLLISTRPIGKNSTKLKLRMLNDLKLVKSDTFYKILTQAIGVAPERGKGVILTDIEVENVNGAPIASVNLSTDNPTGMFQGDVSSWELPHINDLESYRLSNRELLLGDEE